MNHTPGPWNTWRLAPESDEAQRYIVVAHQSEYEVCGPIGNPADASLIAAAPEMLDALERCVRALTSGGPTGIEDGVTVYGIKGTAISGPLNAARAAIALAKGGA